MRPCALCVLYSAIFSADLRDPIVRLDAASSLLQRIGRAEGTDGGGTAEEDALIRGVALWCMEGVCDDHMHQWTLSRGRAPVSAKELLLALSTQHSPPHRTEGGH
jgi:hypothetical protein